jgi:hypothetical protein
LQLLLVRRVDQHHSLHTLGELPVVLARVHASNGPAHQHQVIRQSRVVQQLMQVARDLRRARVVIDRIAPCSTMIVGLP